APFFLALNHNRLRHDDPEWSGSALARLVAADNAAARLLFTNERRLALIVKINGQAVQVQIFICSQHTAAASIPDWSIPWIFQLSI
ncbi:MAG: hypothetical protein K2W91_06750, partial [Novosphingobium sp.]|nr:hypothetical protein [Novosphingobium sp.]